jgi:tRNA pseudouridine38-40 synthase
MPRYFLEICYKGTNYSGFQVQKNGKTIQSEVENALQLVYKQSIRLTGSSRTDAGVHALQNYFHFDMGAVLSFKELYNINAILPPDISVKGIYNVSDEAHCRFDALTREYKYFIYHKKNPFLYDRAWYYPFRLNKQLLHQAAQMVEDHGNFIAFSKRKTQVNNFKCEIEVSQWLEEDGCLIYNVKANRFLRGMVRALVSSMLKVARETLTIDSFKALLESDVQSSASFAAPAHGLFLTEVSYPNGFLERID